MVLPVAVVVWVVVTVVVTFTVAVLMTMVVPVGAVMMVVVSVLVAMRVARVRSAFARVARHLLEQHAEVQPQRLEAGVAVARALVHVEASIHLDL